MESKIDIFAIDNSLVANLLRNTIETYPPEWRLIQEPLQNAIDSFVDDKGNNVDMMGIEPKVTVEIYLGSNKVRIIDNGRGIPVENYGNFLQLGNGTKGAITNEDVKRLMKGSQGVGIKSTVFTSKRFEVTSICEGKKWNLALDNYCDYKSNEFNSVVEMPETVDTDEHSGTSIIVTLNDYSTFDFISQKVDDFFRTIGIDEDCISESGIALDDDTQMPLLDIMKILLRYFKKESYAGCVTRIINPGMSLPDVIFEIKVICDFSKDLSDDFIIPGIKALSPGKELVEVDKVGYIDYQNEVKKLPSKAQPKIITDYKAVLESGKGSDRLTVFTQVLSREDIRNLCGKLRKRKDSDPLSAYDNILEEYKSRKHDTALERVNGAILFIAPRPFLKNPFVHRSTIGLSVNGLPTDISLEISGGELGYVPSVHLILDVQETLGYGKRNLPPRSKGMYNALAKTLWVNLRKLAKLVIGNVEPDTDPTLTGNRMNPNEELAKIIIDRDRREKYFELTGRVTEPETEEDLISVYYYMVGKGLLKKYEWMRLNDNTIYDAMAKVTDSSGPLTIEFKYDIKSLCESDFEGRQKFSEMDLAIVWKSTSEETILDEYTCIPKEVDTNFKNHLPDVNYRLKHDRNTVQVIALKDIVDENLI